MKTTDYAPRSAGIDAHLTGRRLYGIEVGCDVGAHAEALLRYCSVDRLVLVDTWENDFCRGYCTGRLVAQGWKNNVTFIKSFSHAASVGFDDGVFDFVYIDIAHDSEIVLESLIDWWPKLKNGGVLGYRNYTKGTIAPVVDQFIEDGKIKHIHEQYHNDMILFKEI